MPDRANRDDLHTAADHDLLIMAVEQMHHLRDDFDKISNGTGFPRCVARLGKIESIEKKMDAHFDSHVYYKRKMIVALGVIALGAWWETLSHWLMH